MSIKNLSLRIKFGIIPVFFVSLFAVSVFLIFSAQNQQKSDAEIVNVAGRQRMLSQKIAFLATRFDQGEVGVRKELMEALHICDESLTVLRSGGIAPGMTGLEIPAAPLDIQDQLGSTSKQWNNYKQQVQRLLEGDANGLVYLKAHSNKMLASFNSLVQAYVMRNKKKQQQLNWLLLFLLVLNVLAGFLVVYASGRYIRIPIIKITDQLALLAKGKLSVQELDQRNDEIGNALKGLNELAVALKGIDKFADEISRGNFNTTYQLLSEEDAIGQSLLRMKTNIRDILQETHTVIDSVANQGDFQARVNLRDKEGAWNDLSRSTNIMLESISSPLNEIKSVLKSVSNGDLSVSFTGHSVGEIADLTNDLNRTILNLGELIAALNTDAVKIENASLDMMQSGDEISRSSTEIASAVGQISSGAQSQMQEVDESSALLEGMNKSFKESSKILSEIRDLALSNSSLGEQGAIKMQEIISLNESVLSSFEKSNDAVLQLSKRSEEINEIINTISEISSETSLLALNANIEAAHAGDQGRGFAVVADQIRRLATNSKNSSNQIERLISDIQSDINYSIKSFESMSAHLSNSVAFGHATNQVILDMSKSVKKTHEFSSSVFSTVQMQETSLKALLARSEAVVAVASQSAAGTEEVAASSEQVSAAMEQYMSRFEELRSIASSLRDRADMFKVLDSKASKSDLVHS